MAATWDAIVIGGGHNGLVAGAYLAKAGARTVVLEARHKTGGAAATDAPWPQAPDLKVTRLSYVMSLMPPGIIRDLDLERHGYKVFPMGPYYQAWPDGRSLKLHADDARRNHDEIARFSKWDADAMPRWDAWLEGLAAVLGPLLMVSPPKLGSRRWSDVRELLRLAWRHRGLDVRTVGDATRLMTMSISDLLDDWFESEQVKVGLAINGVIGTWAGPDSPGTAYVIAHHSIGDVGDGHLGSWGFPEGGMGAVADAIRRSAEELGATVRTRAPVERVLVTGGRATGVVLRGGEELHAPVVVTAVHPKITFLDRPRTVAAASAASPVTTRCGRPSPTAGDGGPPPGGERAWLLAPGPARRWPPCWRRARSRWWGASARPGSFGNQLLAQLLQGGYRGAVHPVNPGTGRCWGSPATGRSSAAPRLTAARGACRA